MIFCSPCVYVSRYVLQGIEPKVRIRRSFAVLNSWKENFFNVSRRLANLSRRAIVFPFNFLIGLNRIFRKKELMIDCPIKERYLKEKEEEIFGYFFFCNFSLSCCLFLDNSKTLSFFFFFFYIVVRSITNTLSLHCLYKKSDRWPGDGAMTSRRNFERRRGQPLTGSHVNISAVN